VVDFLFCSQPKANCMWPFPKKFFKWQEPKAFRQTLLRVEARQAKWWVKPLVAFLFAALGFSQWLLAKNPPPFWAAFPTFLAFGLLFGYGLPRILSLCPAYIMIFDKRICRVVGNTHRAWELADLTAYSWRDCDEYDLLVFEHNKGAQVLIGVPPQVSRAELESFFAARGLEKVRVSSGTVSSSSVWSTAASSKT
jgi:hypothetical protein